MMAGILIGFGLRAAAGFAADPVVIAVLVVVYAAASVWMPRYALLVLLAVALTVTALLHGGAVATIGPVPLRPTLTAPAPTWPAILGLALPLLLTTLSGQYLPGMAILRANGFAVSARSILVAGGIAPAGAAFLGGISTALASITAAFCAGRESHEDPARRYVAGVACGVFFCLGAVSAGHIVEILTLLPGPLIALLAALALLRPILNVTGAMLAAKDPQAGLVAFLFTASGVTLLDIGAAFWGIVAGLGFDLTTRLARWMRPG